ncbi:class A beta-lactamase [Trinickia violacea]|uniref:beta-lactamase n=1 Tax=Trinickia violacea TaxID=2571746 RepID=A0A4V1EII3_9BURK|nr:class A beta-lactamase [Trinickia violacea]QCP53870.1 class A beta-lactamase [Trinickia violacea]
MKPSALRRSLLLAAVSTPLVGACASLTAGPQRNSTVQAELAKLEASSGGRLGLAAIDTGSGARLLHRADERFAFCSTFKVIAASAILKRSENEPGLLERRVIYSTQDLVTYSPITKPNVASGMTVAELCAAAIDYSDNTAGNLLMKILGGPQAVTAFARSIGNETFRLDRWETELNTAIPGDLRDTSTPASMAHSLQQLALGDALAPRQREQLQAWLRANTTGGKRIRAGVPADWQVGDKTGTGDYGTTNDIGVVWRPSGAPLVIAIYFTQPRQDASPRDDVLAAAARIVAAALG